MKTLSWTDNNTPGRAHEVWKDDGTGNGYELLATLESGTTTYEDADGDDYSAYNVRAIWHGDPSYLVNFPAALSRLYSEGSEEDARTAEDGSTVRTSE